MRLAFAVAAALALGFADPLEAQILDGVTCLTGSQETPPNASPGTGNGRLTLNTSTGLLSFSIGYGGLLGTVTDAHFHLGDCGVMGGIVVPLATTNPIVGSVTLTPAQVAAVLAGDWYVNVHSNLFPGGEIRGQLDFDGSSSCVPCGLQTCFGPDHLNGPCWDPAIANLPDFPPTDQPAAGICWTNCQPDKQEARLRVGAPSQVICGQYKAPVEVLDPAGAVVLTGAATLDYTRTWEEITPDPLDRQYQVWRFVAKIDFSDGPDAAPVCYDPPCLGPAPAHPTCFWYGYVDYAQNCFTGQWESAVVLFHNCDDFIHHFALSDRPGVFHPSSQYAVVAPDTAVNPFVPGILTPTRSGPLVAEAVRNVDNFFAPGACTFEEPVVQGALQLLGAACFCPLSLQPRLQTASRFAGSAACGSSWLSIQLFNLPVGFKWFEMIATTIGTWTTDAAYPGREIPWAEEGFFVYHDSCAAAVGKAPDTLDMFYGAKTDLGYEVLPTPDGDELSRRFVDLASNYSRPFVALPLLGSVRPTDHLIYVNVLE